MTLSTERERGLTLIELVAVVVILTCVAAAVLPLGINTVRRTRELQLRRGLTTLRHAIDQYHKYAASGSIKAWDPDWEQYPRDLEMLVEGVDVINPNGGVPRKVKFLRTIPSDPMTGQAFWGMRSYQDDSDDSSWGGENVYDVYSQSSGTALDGTYYADW